MQILNDGEYVEIGGRPAVRFVRRYPHPAQKVWDTITDPAQFRHWFPHPNVEYERRLGGTIRMSGDPYDPEGSEGTVLAWDPPREFGFDWGKDQVFLVVSEEGEGSRLELVNVLAERGGAARNGAGWDFCLGDLADALDGRPRKSAEEKQQQLDDDPAAGFGEFLPVLEQYKSKGLPDDGWLPDPA